MARFVREVRALERLGRMRPALTDVYDVERRVLLVRYPTALIVALALTGLVAFAVTGFLGYPDDPPLVARLFRQPWALFVWLCALLLTLLASIFRHPALRLRLALGLTLTLASLGALGLLYLFRDEVAAAVGARASAGDGGPQELLLTNAWTYTLLNGVVLAVYWADTARRWLRRARGLPPNPYDARESASPHDEPRHGLPRVEDLISGDLIAGAALALVLALLLQPAVVALIGQLAGLRAPVTACAVAFPGPCRAAGEQAGNPPALAFADLALGLIAFSLGALVLALGAMLSGLGAMGGVDEGEVEDPRLLRRDESSTESVSEQVGLTVINTLRSAVNRRVQMALRNLALSLRVLVWPALLLLATAALALVARALQAYLHSDRSTQAIVGGLLPALGWGALALAATVGAAALLAFSRRVVDNTLRFLGVVGFVVLLTFWLYSLALWGLDVLLRDVGLTRHDPFTAPGISTALSLLALVAYGTLALRAAGRRGTARDERTAVADATRVQMRAEPPSPAERRERRRASA